MSDNTKIEWTDATWNPITGCSVVSPGCTNCYAMKLAGTRLKHHPTRAGLTVGTKAGPVWNGQVRFNEGVLTQPLKWKRPRMIFVCAHGDLFHPDVPDEWIDKVFGVMALASQHTFQVLTKRPERMREYLSEETVALRWEEPMGEMHHETGAKFGLSAHIQPYRDGPWPLPNVWLGTSVEDQRRADERIPHLLQTPAAIRFLSAEPLLGPIDLTNLQLPGSLSWNALGKLAGLHWVIASGESGPGARPMHPDWARTMRDQCTGAGVAFFFKQWGEWLPFGQSGFHHWSAANVRNNGAGTKKWLGHAHFNDGAKGPETHSLGPVETLNIGSMLQSVKLGKKTAGRLLDGIEHSDMPVTDHARAAA